jgi:hypothetical protein
VTAEQAHAHVEQMLTALVTGEAGSHRWHVTT